MTTVKIKRLPSQAETDAAYLRLRVKHAGEPVFTTADAARRYDRRKRLAEAAAEYQRLAEWKRAGVEMMESGHQSINLADRMSDLMREIASLKSALEGAL